jgi:uncharacterized protein YaiI (UPF0178 family)
MKILIDGDGCPVVDCTIRLAEKYQVDCIIFCDTAHALQGRGAAVVTLSKGKDSADFAIVNRAERGDIVVTQDYGLAAMCLAKEAAVIRQDGLIFSDANIDSLLLSRHTASKIRRAGGRLKGPKKRSMAENIAFEKALNELLSQLANINQ